MRKHEGVLLEPVAEALQHDWPESGLEESAVRLGRGVVADAGGGALVAAMQQAE